jgi:hypothetical protein
MKAPVRAVSASAKRGRAGGEACAALLRSRSCRSQLVVVSPTPPPTPSSKVGTALHLHSVDVRATRLRRACSSPHRLRALPVFGRPSLRGRPPYPDAIAAASPWRLVALHLAIPKSSYAADAHAPPDAGRPQSAEEASIRSFPLSFLAWLWPPAIQLSGVARGERRDRQCLLRPRSVLFASVTRSTYVRRRSCSFRASNFSSTGANRASSSGISPMRSSMRAANTSRWSWRGSYDSTQVVWSRLPASLTTDASYTARRWPSVQVCELGGM